MQLIGKLIPESDSASEVSGGSGGNKRRRSGTKDGSGSSPGTKKISVTIINDNQGGTNLTEALKGSQHKIRSEMLMAVMSNTATTESQKEKASAQLDLLLDVPYLY